MNSKYSKYSIRPARPTDAPRLAELSGQLGYPSSSQALSRRLAAISALPDQFIMVAVDPDQIVVGWVHAFIYRVLESEPMVEVGGLVVDQDARSQGVGRELMEAVEHWAVTQGITVISLRSNVVRVEAHEFYRHLGYTIPKTQYTFRKNLSPNTEGHSA